MREFLAFIRFSFAFFFPLVILLLLYSPFWCLLAFTDLSFHPEYLVVFAPYVWFVLGARWCYSLWPGARTYRAKAGLLYVFWVLLSAPLMYVFSAMMAGVSMAYVDGVARGWDLLLDEVLFTARLVLLSHIVFLPWLALSLGVHHWSEGKAGRLTQDKPAAL